MNSYTCKICKSSLKSWALLVEHWIAEHPEEYDKVQAWVDNSSVSVKELERIADECMKGRI